MIAIRTRRIARTAMAAGALLAGSLPMFAASTDTAPRITQKIDDQKRVTLNGNVPSIARPEFDKGAVPSGTALGRMQLVLKRSGAQENELKQLIDQMHQKGSPNFHKWLTPAEFGQRFGVGDSDLATVTAWLQAKGFSVEPASKGRNTLEFSGTEGQLKAAFGTEIHTYERKGLTFHANNANPSIPAALAPVVHGIASLNDIQPKSDLKVLGEAKLNTKTHKATPEWNAPLCPTGGTEACLFYAPIPADMAVQYNSTGVLSGGTTGKGVNIGILSASNIDLSVFNNYRTTFGLPSQSAQVVVDGNDPGQNGAATEAYLDVEASGAMAPGAQVMMYTGASTLATDGLTNAIVRAVNDDVADVMSLSYGECEQTIGATGNQFFYLEWQQAAAQGQSVFVSAGDGGSAGCDDFDTEAAAQYGLAVSGFASTPYNTAVGGTDFYYSDYAQGYFGTGMQAQFAQYWGTTSSDTPQASLISTIPEQPWNDSLGLNVYSASQGQNIVAGSGGASSCAFGSGDDGNGGYTACTGGYPKPSWQTGTGVPNDGVRDLPDVSLFAANGDNYSFWPICAGVYDCDNASSYTGGAIGFTGVGGTSASSPAMAGVMALIDQAMGGRQGLANYYLYQIAAQHPTDFNDITVGSNNVVCVQGSPDCSLDTNGDGYYSLQEYPATVGYDQASGLGSLNIAGVIKDWGNIALAGTTTSLTLTPTTIVHGTAVTATASVTSSSGTPTGTVGLITSSTAPSSVGQAPIVLTAGTGSETTASLPGGTYNVTGVYYGDGAFGSSTSSAVAVTVTPEASTTTLAAAGYDINGNVVTLASGGTYPYGNLYYVDATITGASGYGIATGSVNYTDNGTSFGLNAVNSGNATEQVTARFAPGTHSVVANYSGDASFNASASTALPFTVTKGTPLVISEDTSATFPLYAGQTFQVPVVVVGTYAGGTAPSGTVTVTFGTATATATLSPAVGFGAAVGTATVSFPNITAGSFPLSIAYSGDGNYAAANSAAETVTVAALGTLINTTTTVATTNTNGVGPQGTLTLSATVTAASGAIPTGVVYFYSNGIYLGGAVLSTTGTATDTFYYPNIFTGDNSITAQYGGSSTDAPSLSTAIAVSGNVGDFALQTSTPTITIPSSNTYTGSLQLYSLSGLGGTVTLTCTPSSSDIFCGFQGNSSVTLPTDGSQVNVPLVISNQTLKSSTSSSIHNSPLRKWLEGGSVAFALLFFVFPARRRITIKVLMLLVAAGLAVGATGCSSSGNTISGGGTNTAPAGTYSVTITAVNGGVTHAVTIQVINP